MRQPISLSKPLPGSVPVVVSRRGRSFRARPVRPSTGAVGAAGLPPYLAIAVHASSERAMLARHRLRC
jgi:hypothetical protein